MEWNDIACTTQVGGTEGLLVASRRGLPYVKELDAIMQNILADLPLLLANWNSASHIQLPPRRQSSGAGETESGSASTTVTPGSSGSTTPAGI